MATLVDVLKARREKKADGTAGAMISRLVPEVLEETVNQLIRRATQSPPAHKLENQVEQQVVKQAATDEEATQQYRESRPVSTPVAPSELGLTVGLGVGSNYVMPRLINKLPLSKLHSEAPSLGQAAMQTLGPEYLPLTVLTALGLNHLTAPLSDPLYHQGRRGYWKSVGEGLGGAADSLQQRGHEARERYGVAGVPVQMLHGIMNPVASTVYAGRSLRDYLRSKQGSDLALTAEKSVHGALNAEAQAD